MGSTDDRYARHERLGAIGVEGQARLKGAHVMVIGLGALGCVSADQLARAGVGTLTVVDRDVVERSNLHRQPLYVDEHAEKRAPKAVAAGARLRAANPDITVHAEIADFTPGNALDLIEHTFRLPDVLVDGTDNFQTRYLINDCAVKLGIPYVYGGAIGTSGSVGVVRPGRGACLRCVAPTPPPVGSQPTCESAGVLAPVSAVVGSMQAIEAVRLIVDPDDPWVGPLVTFDGWTRRRSEIDLEAAHDPGCVCCVEGRFEFLDDMSAEPTTLCGRNAVQIAPAVAGTVDLGRVHETLSGAVVPGDPGPERHEYMVRAAIEHPGQAGATIELTCFLDGRAIVEGTADAAVARSVYARYIGT